jgi:dual specificity protein kinase YAK1
MWSFGCIVAELYLGLPLFPGLSEFDLLTRMLDILGGQPPDYILKEAKNTSKFFKFVGSVNSEESGYMSKHSAYQVLTLEEYQARESKIPKIGKDYYIDMQLRDIVTKYPYRQNLSDEDVLKESRVRLALVDFLKGLVEFDPAKRWSPLQASKHPFVTGEPFTCPYTPSPETPRMSVSHNIRVDHHPAGGHWFAAGLSPNVAGVNRVALQNNSPHYQVISYPHAGGSYGSLGSHGGSYQDGGVGAGSSYGSYGDNNINNYNNNMHPFYSPVGPSGMNMPHHAQGGIGTSPDARRRFIHNNFPHGNTGVGFSPTGNFAPMSLGTSPSQFTPPGSHYGPSSPARGNTHGSPLGKAAAVGQFNNRRKNWGYSGNMQSPENSFSSSPHWQGLYSDAEPNSPVQTWRQGGGGGGNNGGYSSSHNFSSVPTHGSNMQFLHPKGVAIHDKPEASNSLPDPGDWDPNYSDELLLEEDGSEVNLMSNEFSKSMHLIQHTDPSVAARRYPNIPPPMQRQNGAIQGFAHGDPGSPPSSHDLHMGYGISPPMTKPPPHLMPQNSPSRLGQQPPRFNHGRSTSIRGNDWNHHQQQPQFQPQSFSGFNSGGPRSPGSTNGTSPWGRRGNYPVVNNMNNIPPTSRGRKDYGRIS